MGRFFNVECKSISRSRCLWTQQTLYLANAKRTGNRTRLWLQICLDVLRVQAVSLLYRNQRWLAGRDLGFRHNLHSLREIRFLLVGLPLRKFPHSKNVLLRHNCNSAGLPTLVTQNKNRTDFCKLEKSTSKCTSYWTVEKRKAKSSHEKERRGRGGFVIQANHSGKHTKQAQQIGGEDLKLLEAVET